MDTKIDQVNESQELSSESLLSPRPAHSDLCGRDLDAAVDGAVFGRHVVWEKGRPLRLSPAANPAEWEVPRYSASIYAAWEIVKHFQDKRYMVSVNASSDNGGWWCCIYPPVGDWIDSHTCGSAPEAICRAALAAVENNSDTKTVSASLDNGKG